MEKGKMIAFTTEEAEYIAEALQDAIDDSNNMGTDNEVFNRAPRLRDLLNRVIDKYELPDPWSDRPDLDAMDKVTGMDPDQRSAADAGKPSEPVEGKREKEVDQGGPDRDPRKVWNAYMRKYRKEHPAELESICDRMERITEMARAEGYAVGSTDPGGDWGPAGTAWSNLISDLETISNFIADAVGAKTDIDVLSEFIERPVPMFSKRTAPNLDDLYPAPDFGNSGESPF